MDRPSDNWYVRASSMGALMSKGRGKGNEWGSTAMGVIQEAVLLNKYGIKTQIQSKYLDKGIINEPVALEMFYRAMDIDVKSTDQNAKTRRFNDYITGEPDIYIDGVLGDVKCSFNASTFPFLHDGDLKSLNKSYHFQMQSYMYLFDCSESYLAYCLTDTPDHMIEDDVQRRTFKAMTYPENAHKDMSQIEDEIRDQVNKEMRFNHIPEKSRIRMYKIDRDLDEIELIKARVIEARKKYDEIYELL